MDLTPETDAVAGAEARIDLPRLRRLLGARDTAWLVERVRRRLEREEPLTTTVSLSAPTAAQRAAAERLLGRAPGSGRSLSLRLDAVDEVLRRSGVSPGGLAAAVEALTGPVTPLRERRDAQAQAWSAAHGPLADITRTHPQLSSWAGQLRSEGVVRRLVHTPAATRTLLTRAAAVLCALPVDPATSLPAFAARTVGGAHALDDGTPLATVVLSGIRALTGIPHGTGAQWRRAAWAAAGLLRDDLSSTVLVLNLRGTPALDWLADTGEPAVLTLRQVTVRPPDSTATPAVVRVCENPAVIAAAAEAYGPGSPPLLCLQGQPSAAALTLLSHLRSQGATLLYHGDFDWGGLRIANSLLRHAPWQPWRYTAADYRAVPHAAAPALTGTPTEAAWDPDLSQALQERGVRIEEELVIDTLLGDLGDA